MKINNLKISKFKNLKDFELNLQNNSNNILVTVGKNSTGKSNLLEAIVLIFRNLFLYENKSISKIYEDIVRKTNQPFFDFTIEYECNGHNIRVIFEKIKKDDGSELLFPNQDDTVVDFIERKYTFQLKKGNKYVNIDKEGKIKDKDYFYDKDDKNQFKYLPTYIFAYYSGISNRLETHFDYHQRQFYNDLMNGLDNPFRPLFYARPVHSNFVLLAFYAFQDETISAFLSEKLNITDLDSVLFVLKRPEWYSNDKNSIANYQKAPRRDKRFWYSKGVVADFIKELFDKSLAPIKDTIEIRTDFNHSDKGTDCWYLFLESQEKLKEVATAYCKLKNVEAGKENVEFFKALESTYISDLIHETRIKVKKKNTDGSITFKELSEGEQQLLTVIGLLKFTNHAESLFLLDEPDTHLSPIWGHEYLKMLKDISGQYGKSQMFLSTHKPTTISGLEKEQILVFRKDEETGKTIVDYADIDAKGLSADGILKQIFEMDYTYDDVTYGQMLRRRELFAKKMFDETNFTEAEGNELATLTDTLSDYAGNYADGLFYEFIHELDKSGGLDAYQKINLTDKEKEERRAKAEKLLAQLRQKRNKS